MRRAALLLACAALGGSAQAATVVMVPGSGFNGAEADRADRMSLRAPTWRSWGFRTVVAPYDRGRAGFADVRRALERARARRPNQPLVVYGESSGGTWALLAAAQGLADRAVVLAAPTDQETLAASPFGPARHLGRDTWPRYFGPEGVADRFEPYDVWLGGPPAVPLLLAYSHGDRIVPVQQGELLASADPAIALHVLERGTHNFVHADVDPADFVRTRRAIRAFATANG